MRILCVINSLCCGGAENLLLDTCIALKESGDEVCVAYLYADEFFLPQFMAAGIRMKYLGFSEKGIAKGIISLSKFINEYKPQIVHTHLIQSDTYTRLVCLLKPRLRVFTTMHSLDKWKTENNPAYMLLRLYNRLTVNLFKKNRLIAVSESVKTFCSKYEKVKPDKIDVVYCFVRPNPQKNQLSVNKSDLGFKETDFVCLNVGRLVAEKSQITILQAANELKKKGISDIKFVFVGSGDLFAELRSYVKENALEEDVLFAMASSNVYSYMKMADVLLVSSVIEGFGLVIYEAFLNALPVISSKIEATSELIIDGVNGIFYPPEDFIKLSEAILSAKNGDFDLSAMSKEGLKDFEERDMGNYVNELRNIYKNSLK